VQEAGERARARGQDLEAVLGARTHIGREHELAGAELGRDGLGARGRPAVVAAYGRGGRVGAEIEREFLVARVLLYRGTGLITLVDTVDVIGRSVAVVIDLVAPVGCARMNACGAVVAIGLVGNVAFGCRAGLGGRVGIAVGIAIGVGVERGHQAFISLAVAVVIHAVACFGRGIACGRANGICTIRRADHGAVCASADAAAGAEVGVTFVGLAVAVVVHAVAGFDRCFACGRTDGFGAVLRTNHGAVCAGTNTTAGTEVGVTFVGRAVAVVVHAVADVAHGRMNVGITIVAVHAVRDIPQRGRTRLNGCVGVAIGVAIDVSVKRELHVLVGRAVAVVVHAIAGFGRIRVNASVTVVAVGLVCDVPLRGRAGLGGRVGVAIRVPVRVGVVRRLHVLVGHSVAVVVFAIANLGLVRVDARIRVIAVRVVGHPAFWLQTGALGNARLRAIAVAIGIDPILGAANSVLLISRAIAIVVLAIAGFGAGVLHLGRNTAGAVAAVAGEPARVLARRILRDRAGLVKIRTASGVRKRLCRVLRDNAGTHVVACIYILGRAVLVVFYCTRTRAWNVRERILCRRIEWIRVDHRSIRREILTLARGQAGELIIGTERRTTGRIARRAVFRQLGRRIDLQGTFLGLLPLLGSRRGITLFQGGTAVGRAGRHVLDDARAHHERKRDADQKGKRRAATGLHGPTP